MTTRLAGPFGLWALWLADQASTRTRMRVVLLEPLSRSYLSHGYPRPLTSSARQQLLDIGGAQGWRSAPLGGLSRCTPNSVALAPPRGRYFNGEELVTGLRNG